jgi:PadR family transcriptional regulator, regulatory protein PadR
VKEEFRRKRKDAKERQGSRSRGRECAAQRVEKILVLHFTAMYSTAMKLAKDLVAASTVPLVLSILEEGESYGYAIIQRVRELSGGEMEWTDGMLYPVLHWLEERGYVQARWREGESGRQRKYYSIKAAGRKHLAEQRTQWLTVHETLKRAWKIGGLSHA